MINVLKNIKDFNIKVYDDFDLSMLNKETKEELMSCLDKKMK